jgi:hypothetical protein
VPLADFEPRNMSHRTEATGWGWVLSREKAVRSKTEKAVATSRWEPLILGRASLGPEKAAYFCEVPGAGQST